MNNIPSSQIPHHVAIILDGNGRWAKKRNLPISAGHQKGTENVEKILEHAERCGVKIVSLYAFSKENWKRGEEEKSFLFKLLIDFFTNKINKIITKGARIKFIGDLSAFPPSILEVLDKAEKRSINNTNTIIQIALSYGGQDEIVRAAKEVAKQALSFNSAREAEIFLTQLDETKFSTFLDTKGLPDPDLLIRTGGDFRISNFLLYQCAYSEFYFTKTLWPDFSEKEFEEALSDFQKRERRFGSRISE